MVGEDDQQIKFQNENLKETMKFQRIKRPNLCVCVCKSMYIIYYPILFLITNEVRSKQRPKLTGSF